MKPILFNTEMVMAILNGRKTATRRVVKPIPPENARLELIGDRRHAMDLSIEIPGPDDHRIYTPPYLPGDILYVREKFACDGFNGYEFTYVYWTDVDDCGRVVWGDDEKGEWAPSSDYRWRPSIHMPKEAARIFLRVTDVRLERLQDITVDGINSEGVDVEPPPICRKGDPTESERAAFAKLTVQKQDEYISTLARHTYMGWCKYADDLFVAWKNLWDSTIKPADIPFYGWDANPWVWVIEFERCEKPKEE